MDVYIEDIQIDSWAVYEKIDLTKRDGKPVLKIMDVQGTWVFNEHTAVDTIYYLKMNIINTMDDYVNLGFYSYIGEFYDIGKMIDRPIIKSSNKAGTEDLIYKSTMILHNESLKITRQIYNIFDLLGDLGGVTEVIMIVFGFFLFSISEHSFYLTALTKLFFARTSDGDMFKSKRTSKYLNRELIPESTPRHMKDEILKHRYIDIKTKYWVKVYFARILGDCCCNCMFKRKDRFMKLYERGQDRVEAELNIVKIMKSLRDMKILMKNSMMDKQVRYQIRHSEKNILNLDSTSSEEYGDEVEEPQTKQKDQENDQGGCDQHFHMDNPNEDAHAKKMTMNPEDIQNNLTNNIMKSRML